MNKKTEGDDDDDDDDDYYYDVDIWKTISNQISVYFFLLSAKISLLIRSEKAKMMKKIK